VSRGHFYLPFSEITDEEVEKLLTAFPQRDTTLFQAYDGSELAIAIAVRSKTTSSFSTFIFSSRTMPTTLALSMTRKLFTS
jgi:hypothetical protein